jgi:membrane-bound lytic murein transglycosylase B
MRQLLVSKGRVEIEVYRQAHLIRERVLKLFKKYSALYRIAALSVFLTVLPVLNRPAVQGFPPTTLPLVFTSGAQPLVLAENGVKIEPGESPAEKEERERKAAQQIRQAVSLVRSVRTEKTTHQPCPESFRPFYQEVGPRFGVPWQVLEAIHQVESGKSCHTGRRSRSGATGPMQFIPSTWRHYQWDCTGDGVTDITDAYDSICTAAHYIGTGLTGYSLERAIYSYNRSWGYVNKVMTIAREIGL